MKKKLVITIAVVMGIVSAIGCNIAYSSENNLLPDINEHYYTVKAVTNNDINYVCTDCGDRETILINDVIDMWSVNYLNNTTNTTGVDNSCYLDIVTDGIINAKDYAKLKYIKNFGY